MKNRNNLDTVVANLISRFGMVMGGRSQYTWKMMANMLQGHMQNGTLIGADPERVALAAMLEEEEHDALFELVWSESDRKGFLKEVLSIIRS